jgi:hypothetical protein
MANLLQGFLAETSQRQAQRMQLLADSQCAGIDRNHALSGHAH